MKRLVLLLILICLVVPAITLVNPSIASATTKQILPGGYYDLLRANATEYNALLGGYTWDATENARWQGTSPPGKHRKLKVNLYNSSGAAASPGDGKSYAFTVMVDSSPTALTLTISDTNTSGSDIAHDIDLVGGQTISLRCVPTGTPTTVYARWSTEFESTNSAECWLPAGLTGSNGTYYSSIMGKSSFGSDPDRDCFFQPFPINGTLSKMYVVLVAAVGTSATIATFKPYVVQNLTVTFNNVQTELSDLVHTDTITKGDLFVIKGITVTVSSRYAAIGFTFTTGTDGESVLMGTVGNALNSSPVAIEYQVVAGGSDILPEWQSTAEHQSWQRFDACTLRSFYVALSAAPGTGGDEYALSTRDDGATVQTCTIVNAATTGEDTTDAVIVDGSMVNLKCESSNTPSATPFARWGWVMYIAPASGSCSANISEVQASYDFGTIVESGSKASGLTNFTLTNSSGGAVSVVISATDMTGTGIDWTISSVPGADQYIIKAGTISAYSITLSGTPATLFSSIVDSGTKPWGLKLWAPTSFSNGNVKSGTVTVTATCL
jgi:hypothetical protein